MVIFAQIRAHYGRTLQKFVPTQAQKKELTLGATLAPVIELHARPTTAVASPSCRLRLPLLQVLDRGSSFCVRRGNR